jgi:magnesium chelatase family protein
LVEVPPLTVSELDEAEAEETSAKIAERVWAAWKFGERRRAQSGLGARGSLEEQARVSGEARTLLRQALADDILGGRGYARVVRLARTIADLDASSSVHKDHVAEALGLRMDSRRVGPFS